MTQALPPPQSTEPGFDTGPRVTRDQIRDVSRLRRSNDDRWVAGVSGGIARHLDIDPLLVRVIFAVLAIFGGAGVLVYAMAWIAMPADGESESILSRSLRRAPDVVLKATIVIAAAIAAFVLFGAVEFLTPHPGPVIVIGLIAVVVIAFMARRNDAPSPAIGVPPTNPGDPGATIPIPQPPHRIRRPRSRLFAITLAIAAIAIGFVWIADESGADLVPGTYPAALLAVVAAGLLVGAWWGRSRLLILIGILASIATLTTSAVGNNGVGQRTYVPTSAAALSSSYELGVGQLTLRLDNLADPESLDNTTVAVSATIGQVIVVVPSSIDVSVNAHVDRGDIRGLASTGALGGSDVNVTGPSGPHALILNLKVGLGQITVKRVDCPSDTSVATPPPTSNTTMSQITLTARPIGGTLDVPACH